MADARKRLGGGKEEGERVKGLKRIKGGKGRKGLASISAELVLS